MTEIIQSPFVLVKRLQTDILRILSGIDSAELDTKERQAFLMLQNSLFDARLDIQDYELAETREHQLGNLKDAHTRLESLQHVISNGPLQVFGPVDVAHLNAQIEQIKDRLL